MHKDDLFKARLPQAEVETPAGVIRVRGLSRAEMISLGSLDQDIERIDAETLRLGVVTPELTAEDVQRWREAWSAADIQPIADKIAELTGLDASVEQVEDSFRSD